MTSSDEQDSAGETEARIQAVLDLAEQIASDDLRDGYTHLGAATSGAFRFKWTARLQADGRFIVEETIGAGKVAVRSPLLPRAEVLTWIDERQQRIQAKVDDVKRELAGIQGLPAEPAPPDTERDPLQVYDDIRRMLKEGK